jgi:uncharacterized protein YdbL (DUF1318 family)
MTDEPTDLVAGQIQRKRPILLIAIVQRRGVEVEQIEQMTAERLINRTL